MRLISTWVLSICFEWILSIIVKLRSWTIRGNLLWFEVVDSRVFIFSHEPVLGSTCRKFTVLDSSFRGWEEFYIHTWFLYTQRSTSWKSLIKCNVEELLFSRSLPGTNTYLHFYLDKLFFPYESIAVDLVIGRLRMMADAMWRLLSCFFLWLTFLTLLPHFWLYYCQVLTWVHLKLVHLGLLSFTQQYRVFSSLLLKFLL